MEYKKSGQYQHNSGKSYNSPGGYTLPEAKKALKQRKKKNKPVVYGAVFVILVVTVWLLFDKLFVIRRFEIKGNAEYSYEMAEEAAKQIGILKGDHIFGFDKKSAVELAKYHLPQFDTVEITFDMPDTVVFNVEEAVPCMYVVLGNGGYVLSEGLRVIAAYPNVSECENMGLIKVELGSISKCVAGEFIVTPNGNDELVKQLYSVLKEEGIAAEVTAIDVSDKFDVSFEYKKQFEVLLGDAESFTVKVRYMKAIVNELNPSESGVIDVSDEEHRDATFKPYSKM